jgi:hypothetical protein
MSHRHNREPDWTNFYFKILVLREAGRIIGAVLGVILAIFIYILCLIFPSNGADIAAGVFIFVIVAGAVAVVYLIVYKAITYKPPTVNETFKAIGLVENPPTGTPWFRPDGSHIQYDRATGKWN